MARFFSRLRTPRATLYLLLCGIILAANFDLVRRILIALQFNRTLADNWAESLKQETLSFVALLIMAAYVDLVVRKDETERSRREQDEFEEKLEKRVHTAIANQLTSDLPVLLEKLVNQAATTVSVESSERTLRRLESSVALRLALESTLINHADRFSHVASGVLGESRDSIIDDASLHFTLANVEDVGDQEYLDIRYEFRGKMRKNFYAVMIARGEFKAESRILSGGQVTDAWLILDEKAFAGTIAHMHEAHVRVKYRDTSGNWILEDRPLQVTEYNTPSGILDCKVFTSDITPPAGHEQCESQISFTVRLPARPSGLRWFFDNPIFVEDISFDVTQMWPDWEMDFTLYPFLVGTEDYTQRSPVRQPVYRIVINDWLNRGHGVMLCWERIAQRSKSTKNR